LLTNNSQRTRRDVAAKLARMGIDVEEEHVFTSAIATARFLARQKPGGTAFVIGEGGLLTALHSNGFAVVDHDPDYVVVGEGRADRRDDDDRRHDGDGHPRRGGARLPHRAGADGWNAAGGPAAVRLRAGAGGGVGGRVRGGAGGRRVGSAVGRRRGPAGGAGP